MSPAGVKRFLETSIAAEKRASLAFPTDWRISAGIEATADQIADLEQAPAG